MHPLQASCCANGLPLSFLDRALPQCICCGSTELKRPVIWGIRACQRTVVYKHIDGVVVGNPTQMVVNPLEQLDSISMAESSIGVSLCVRYHQGRIRQRFPWHLTGAHIRPPPGLLDRIHAIWVRDFGLQQVVLPSIT